MRVRRIDKDGDWTFGQGRGNYADGSEGVAQRVCTRLRSFRGDWFLDLEHGLPWLPSMERPADLAQIESEIKRCILTTEGVSEILDFQLSETPQDRRLRISATVRDSLGGSLSSTVQY